MIQDTPPDQIAGWRSPGRLLARTAAVHGDVAIPGSEALRTEVSHADVFLLMEPGWGM
jgi:hypothetical protein